jgi:hypothetical protein
MTPQPEQELTFVRGSVNNAISRVVVVETIYHQRANNNPISVETRYNRITSEEQPFVRSSKINGVSFFTKGWIDRTSIIYLKNDEPKGSNIHLVFGIVPEDKQVYQSIEIATLRPQETLRLPNANSERFTIYGLGGECRYTLVQFPE